jgi:hypothetical protein
MAKSNLEIMWNGDDVQIKMRNTVKKSLLQTALALQAQAVALCQVDSGNLRGSIMVKLKTEDGIQKIDSPDVGRKTDDSDLTEPQENETAHVGSACVYAAAQEFGLEEFGKPNYQFHPYLRPSYDLLSGESLTIFEKNGRVEFKKYFDYKPGDKAEK